MGLEFDEGFAAFEGRACAAGSGEAGVDGLEEFLGDRGLGEREQEGVLEGGAGALGFGVELADGFDLVAEEVDADGAFALGGVDVDDAAADGDLAGHLDDIDLRIADGEEMLDEHVGEVLLADVEVEREGFVVVAAEELHAGGFEGGDDEFGLAGGDLPEGGGALLLDFGVRGEVFKGEDIVAGQAEDGRGIERAGELAGAEDGGVEGFGGLVVGDDHDGGGSGGADKEWKIEGAGSGGEAGDAPAPGASAEMAADTLEGFRVLEIREEFADEGKNHADSSLSDQARCLCEGLYEAAKCRTNSRGRTCSGNQRRCLLPRTSARKLPRWASEGESR